MINREIAMTNHFFMKLGLILFGLMQWTPGGRMSCHEASNMITCINAGGRFLKDIPSENIAVITILRCELKYLTQRDFSKFTDVSDIIIDECNVTQSILNYALSLEGLKVLQILYSNISENYFPALKNDSTLVKLNLQGNKFTLVKKGVFNNLSSLKEIDLSSNAISSIESDAFEGLPSLRRLDLSHNPLSDAFDPASLSLPAGCVFQSLVATCTRPSTDHPQTNNDPRSEENARNQDFQPHQQPESQQEEEQQKQKQEWKEDEREHQHEKHQQKQREEQEDDRNKKQEKEEQQKEKEHDEDDEEHREENHHQQQQKGEQKKNNHMGGREEDEEGNQAEKQQQQEEKKQKVQVEDQDEKRHQQEGEEQEKDEAGKQKEEKHRQEEKEVEQQQREGKKEGKPQLQPAGNGRGQDGGRKGHDGQRSGDTRAGGAVDGVNALPPDTSINNNNNNNNNNDDMDKVLVIVGVLSIVMLGVVVLIIVIVCLLLNPRLLQNLRRSFQQIIKGGGGNNDGARVIMGGSVDGGESGLDLPEQLQEENTLLPKSQKNVQSGMEPSDTASGGLRRSRYVAGLRRRTKVGVFSSAKRAKKKYNVDGQGHRLEQSLRDMDRLVKRYLEDMVKATKDDGASGKGRDGDRDDGNGGEGETGRRKGKLEKNPLQTQQQDLQKNSSEKQAHILETLKIVERQINSELSRVEEAKKAHADGNSDSDTGASRISGFSGISGISGLSGISGPDGRKQQLVLDAEQRLRKLYGYRSVHKAEKWQDSVLAAIRGLERRLASMSRRMATPVDSDSDNEGGGKNSSQWLRKSGTDTPKTLHEHFLRAYGAQKNFMEEAIKDKQDLFAKKVTKETELDLVLAKTKEKGGDDVSYARTQETRQSVAQGNSGTSREDSSSRRRFSSSK